MSWYTSTLSRARSRAQTKGLEFSITEEDLRAMFTAQEGRCYWLGVPLILTEEPKSPFLPSLDRVNSDRGYRADNVVLACLAANYAKNNTDPDRWEEFLGYLLPNREN